MNKNCKTQGKLATTVRVRMPLTKKSTANQRKEHNVEKDIQLVTTLSLSIRVYLYSLSCCCLKILRNPMKYRDNSNLLHGHQMSSILVTIDSSYAIFH